MIRIAGVNLPNKRIEVALTYIYGIGKSRSNLILEECKIDKDKRPKDLTEEEINKIRNEVAKFKIEGDLKREKMMNIRRLKDIKCWRGLRHEKGLPVRGQRTRTNSRTVRGNVRRTMGSGRVKVQKT